MVLKFALKHHLFHTYFLRMMFYIFLKVAKRKAKTIKQCLKIYQAASNRQVNFQKSNIFFNHNTNESIKREIMDILHVKQVDTPRKYLGLTIVIERNKKAVITYIQDRVTSKMNS